MDKRDYDALIEMVAQARFISAKSEDKKLAEDLVKVRLRIAEIVKEAGEDIPPFATKSVERYHEILEETRKD